MRKRILILLPLISLVSCQSKNPDPTKEFVTVTLNPNGGTISQTEFKLSKGTVYTESLFPIPIKENFEFSHWTYNDDSLIPLENTYTIENDVTIKAQYNKLITITFDTDGGTSIEPVKIAENTVFKNGDFQTPKKENYNFDRWVIFSNDKEIEIPEIYFITTDLTLKAKYTKEKSKDEKYIDSLNIKRIKNDLYFYTATFDDYSYSIGENYLNKISIDPSKVLKASCTSFVDNGFYGRNLDLTYSTIPEFIIKTPAKNNRHATLGISYGFALSPEEINTTLDMAGHKILPFYTVDGINDSGLVISVNEVPSIDVGFVKKTSDQPSMNTMMLIRYVLDYASDIEETKQLLKTRSFYTSGYTNELHFLIADAKGNSAVIEFKTRNDGSGYSDIMFYEKGKSNFIGVNSNFTFNDYQGDADKFTSQETNSLTDHAEGVERYNILVNSLKNGFEVKSLDNALDLMSKVYYTKSYSIPLTDNSKEFWFSEFNYNKNRNKNTAHTVENYQYLLNSWKKYFHDWDGAEKRTKYGDFYCSKHSVAYDINKKEMKLVIEETNKIDTVFTLC